MPHQKTSFLKKLISPLKTTEFWENYFEKNHFFTTKTEVKFDFTVEKFEKLLWTHKFADASDIQVNKEGKAFFYNETGSGKDHFGWLMDRYADGCTLIFNGIHRIDPEIAAIAGELDAVFRGPTTVNAFLTPPNSKGFLPHFDTHDVFVCQTDGTKEWGLYGSEMELPLDRQIYLVDQKKMGKSLNSYHLEKGTVLYIPRGMVHGSSTSESFSLHLTIGVRPLLADEYLKNFIDVLAEKDPEFRKSMLTKDAEELSRLVQNFGRLIESKSGNVYLNKLVNERAYLNKISLSKPLFSNRLKNIHQLSELAPETKLKNVYFNNDLLTDHADKIRLIFPGVGISGKKEVQQGYIEMSAITYGAIEFIRNSRSPFSANDLPEIYPLETRLMIIKTLLKSGYLTIVS